MDSFSFPSASRNPLSSWLSSEPSRSSRPAADVDLSTLWKSSVEPEMGRLFAFLDAVRAVYEERACYTEEATAYMGSRFHFPADSVQALKVRIIETLEKSA